MIDYKKGLKVSSYITTGSAKDVYPTHIDELGQGGYRIIDTFSGLKSIPVDRRKIGMLVYTLDTHQIYILAEDNTWQKWFALEAATDIKLDIIDLRYDIDKLRYYTDSSFLKNSLKNGYLFVGDSKDTPTQVKNIGIDNLPLLGAARFPVPDLNKFDLGVVGNLIPDLIKNFTSFVAEHAYLPNPTQPVDLTNLANNLNPSDIFTLVMGGAWLPETFIGNGDILNPLNRQTISSSALAFVKIAISRAFKVLENSSFILATSPKKFKWENDLAESLANTFPTIAKLYGYQNSYNFGTQTQALGDLNTGLLKNTTTGGTLVVDLAGNPVLDESGKQRISGGVGTLSRAVAGADYVDVQDQLAESFVSLIAPKNPDEAAGIDTKKLISRSSIKITKGAAAVDDVPATPDDISGINTILVDTEVKTKQLKLYDETSKFSKYIGLKSSNTLTKTIEWTLPSQGNNDQVLALKNNTELTFVDSKDFDTAKATYITQTKSDQLPNSQALSGLGSGILKLATLSNGKISIASGGTNLLTDDYVTPANYDALSARVTAAQAEIDGLVTALETLTGITIGTAIGGIIMSIVHVASALALASDLNELRDQAIILRKCGNYYNDYLTHYNITFDNNHKDSHTRYDYGISLLAEDSSATETFGNDIDPIHFRIGGRSHYVSGADEAQVIDFVVVPVNDGTKINKWKPKKFLINLSRHKDLRQDKKQVAYGFSTAEVLAEIVDYDVPSKIWNFKQNVNAQQGITTTNLTANAVQAQQLVIPTYKRSEIPVNSPSGAIWRRAPE